MTIVDEMKQQFEKEKLEFVKKTILKNIKEAIECNCNATTLHSNEKELGVNDESTDFQYYFYKNDFNRYIVSKEELTAILNDIGLTDFEFKIITTEPYYDWFDKTLQRLKLEKPYKARWRYEVLMIKF